MTADHRLGAVLTARDNGPGPLTLPYPRSSVTEATRGLFAMLFYRVSHAVIRNDYVSGILYAGPYNGNELGSVELSRMAWNHANYTHPPFTEDCFPNRSDEVCDRYNPWYPDEDDDTPYHDCYTDSECMPRTEDYACGFVSLPDLQDWFYGYRRMLRRHGFVLRIYDVPDDAVRRGRFQAACLIDVITECHEKGTVKERVIR